MNSFAEFYFYSLKKTHAQLSKGKYTGLLPSHRRASLNESFLRLIFRRVSDIYAVNVLLYLLKFSWWGYVDPAEAKTGDTHTHTYAPRLASTQLQMAQSYKMTLQNKDRPENWWQRPALRRSLKAVFLRH